MPDSIWPIIGAATVVLITRVQRRLWIRGYFGFAELLTGFEYGDRPGWLAVTVKLAIAVAAGAVGAIGSDEPILIGAIAAGAGAMALLWPVFFTTEAIPFYVRDRIFELRTVYALFAVSYVALGAVGGWLTQLLRMVTQSPDAQGAIGQVLLDQVSNAVWAAAVIVVSSILSKRDLVQADTIRRDLGYTESEPDSGLDYPSGGTSSDDSSV